MTTMTKAVVATTTSTKIYNNDNKNKKKKKTAIICISLHHFSKCPAKTMQTVE